MVDGTFDPFGTFDRRGKGLWRYSRIAHLRSDGGELKEDS